MVFIRFLSSFQCYPEIVCIRSVYTIYNFPRRFVSLAVLSRDSPYFLCTDCSTLMSAVVPKAPLTKFLRSKLNEGTRVPWTTNFNHLRRVPRHLKLSKDHDPFDPKVLQLTHIPKDRIKFWNIVPGDFVRLRGRYGNKLREVYKIRRLENIVEFPVVRRAWSTH